MYTLIIRMLIFKQKRHFYNSMIDDILQDIDNNFTALWIRNKNEKNVKKLVNVI